MNTAFCVARLPNSCNNNNNNSNISYTRGERKIQSTTPGFRRLYKLIQILGFLFKIPRLWSWKLET